MHTDGNHIYIHFVATFLPFSLLRRTIHRKLYLDLSITKLSWPIEATDFEFVSF